MTKKKPFTLQISPKDGQEPVVTIVLGENSTTVVLTDKDGGIIEKWNIEGKKVVVEKS